jgi:hypothetical protein
MGNSEYSAFLFVRQFLQRHLNHKIAHQEKAHITYYQYKSDFIQYSPLPMIIRMPLKARV